MIQITLLEFMQIFFIIRSKEKFDVIGAIRWKLSSVFIIASILLSKFSFDSLHNETHLKNKINVLTICAGSIILLKQYESTK